MSKKDLPKGAGGILQGKSTPKQSDIELQQRSSIYLSADPKKVASLKQLATSGDGQLWHKNQTSDRNLLASSPRNIIGPFQGRLEPKATPKPRVPGPFQSKLRPSKPANSGDLDSMDEYMAQKPRMTSFSYASQLAFSKPAANTVIHRNLNNVSIALSRNSYLAEDPPIFNSQVASPIMANSPEQKFDKLIITRLSSISLHIGDEDEERENAEHLNTEHNLQLQPNNPTSLNMLSGTVPNLRIEFTPIYDSDGEFGRSGLRSLNKSLNRSFNRSETMSRKNKERSRISGYKSSLFNDISRHETFEVIDSQDVPKAVTAIPNKFGKSRSLRSNESESKNNHSFDIGQLFRKFSDVGRTSSIREDAPPGTQMSIREALAAGMKWYQPHPEGTFKEVWETVKFVLLLYLLIYLPYRVAFVDEVAVIWYVLDKIIDVFFLADLGLNFVTPIIVNYETVFDVKKISREYLTGWFTLDLLGLIPFEELLLLYSEATSGLQLIAQLGKALRLLRLLKLMRLLRTFDFTNSDNFILKFLDANYRGTVFYLLLPNTLLMLFILHLLACVFYLEASWSLDDRNDTWITVNSYEGRDPFYMYIASWYLVVATYTSCGYGDIIANTNMEMTLKIFVMIIGALLYGIFTGRIVDHISLKMEKSLILEKKVRALENVKKNYDVPVSVDLAIVEHLSFKIMHDREAYKRKLDFTRLNSTDRDLLDFLTFVNKFRKIPLFHKCRNFDHIDWVLKLGRKANQVVFREDDVIYSKGDSSSYFYMLHEGKVGVMMAQVPIIPIISIEKGFFGEIELITGTTRMHTVVALSEKVVLYRLELTYFKQLFLEDDDESSLSTDIHTFVEKRIKIFQEAQEQFDDIIRRKFFWKLVLRGRKKKPKGSKLLGLGLISSQESTKPSNGTSKGSYLSKESSDKT